MAEFNIKLHKV